MNPSNPYASNLYGQMPQIQPRPMQRPQQIMQRQPDPQQPKGDGGMGGMMSGMMGGLSDRHSKEEIQKLESANAALNEALSSKASYPDTGAASSGMQALGQQNTPSSHTDFADAPAEKVAAQNVGLQSMPQAQGLQPGQSDIRNPWAKPQQPNLSDLDEAYARMGRGG